MATRITVTIETVGTSVASDPDVVEVTRTIECAADELRRYVSGAGDAAYMAFTDRPATQPF